MRAPAHPFQPLHQLVLPGPDMFLLREGIQQELSRSKYVPNALNRSYVCQSITGPCGVEGASGSCVPKQGQLWHQTRLLKECQCLQSMHTSQAAETL